MKTKLVYALLFAMTVLSLCQIGFSRELSLWERITGFRKEESLKSAIPSAKDGSMKKGEDKKKSRAIAYAQISLRDIALAKKTYLNSHLRVAEYLRQMDGTYWVATQKAFVQYSKGYKVVCVPIYPILTNPLSVEDQKRRPTCFADLYSNMFRLQELDTMVVNVSEIRTPILKNQIGVYEDDDLESRESVTEVQFVGVSNTSGIVYHKIHRVKCQAKCSALSFALAHGYIIDSAGSGTSVSPTEANTVSK